MTILLIRNADTTGYGGAEELILNTAGQLAKKDFEVVLATAMPRLTKKSEASRLQVIKSPWLKWQSWHGWKQLLIPLYFLWLARLVAWYLLTIRKIKPDVLHPQNRDDWIAASIAGKLTSKRVIWSDHADLKHEVVNINTWYKNWQGKLVIWASKFAEKITVDSKAELRDINIYMHGKLDDKILVAYNGVFDVKPKALEKTQNSFVYGVTARLLAQKGLFELIKAFGQIHTKHPETELWLVGDGADRAKLENKAANNNSIKFIGYVENPLDYAASFDVFVFPTYTEGFSLSLIEAAMLELPIITTNVGGNPEIINHEENGLLIAIKDTEALTSAMQRLYDDADLRQKLAKNARSHFLKDFEFSHLVETIYLPLYNKTR